MADITNGYDVRRAALSAATEQVVLFPGDGAAWVDVQNTGDNDVYVVENKRLGSTTDTKSLLLPGAHMSSITITNGFRNGRIKSIALYSTDGSTVQWMAGEE